VTAYLTIDDAPSAEWSTKLAVLRRLGIRGVFFARGDELARRPRFVAAALDDGHVVGNHGWSHRGFSDLSLPECEDEIDRTHRLLERLHADAGCAYEPRYFRFPYGDKGALTGHETELVPSSEGRARGDAIQEMLRARGYSQPDFQRITYRWYHDQRLAEDADWYWTYDCHEWTTIEAEPQHGIRSLEDVFARMEEDVPEGRRGLNHAGSDDIVLVHDHVETGAMFAPILTRLLERGVRFSLPGNRRDSANVDKRSGADQ